MILNPAEGYHVQVGSVEGDVNFLTRRPIFLFSLFADTLYHRCEYVKMTIFRVLHSIIVCCTSNFATQSALKTKQEVLDYFIVVYSAEHPISSFDLDISV